MMKKFKDEGDFCKFFMDNLDKNISSPKILTRLEGGNLSSGIEDIYLGLGHIDIFIELKYAKNYIFKDGMCQYGGCHFTTAQIRNLQDRKKLRRNNNFVVIYLEEYNYVIYLAGSDYNQNKIISNKIYSESFGNRFRVVSLYNGDINLSEPIFNFYDVD